MKLNISSKIPKMDVVGGTGRYFYWPIIFSVPKKLLFHENLNVFIALSSLSAMKMGGGGPRKSRAMK